MKQIGKTTIEKGRGADVIYYKDENNEEFTYEIKGRQGFYENLNSEEFTVIKRKNKNYFNDSRKR